MLIVYFKKYGKQRITSNYPEWMDEISLATISKGYLLPGETVRSAYRRVAGASASRLKKYLIWELIVVYLYHVLV